jgi:protein-S-isoprenylcysteine O-methyltransferase Ste14
MIFGLAVFLLVGITATFWTERVRNYWIRQCDRRPDQLHWRLVGRRVRNPSYSIELRLIGILCLGTVLIVCMGIYSVMVVAKRPNQSMKPTAPFRNESIALATTPCRGLSLSR